MQKVNVRMIFNKKIIQITTIKGISNHFLNINEKKS